MHLLPFILAAALALTPAFAWAQGGAAATVASVEGGAEVLLDGVEPWVAATVGQQLTSGSQVRTGKKGQAVLLFFDGSKVRINKSTQFTIEGADTSFISLRLGLGRFEAWVTKLKGRRFQARTGAVVAAVRGTALAMETFDGLGANVDLYSGSLNCQTFTGPNALADANAFAAALAGAPGLPGGPGGPSVPGGPGGVPAGGTSVVLTPGQTLAFNAGPGGSGAPGGPGGPMGGPVVRALAPGAGAPPPPTGNIMPPPPPPPPPGGLLPPPPPGGLLPPPPNPLYDSTIAPVISPSSP